MADASLDSNYPNSTIQFTNRAGQPAAIDTSTRPLAIEFDDPAQGVITISAPTPTGNKGEFSCDVATVAEGGVTGSIVADSNMTPAGETELRVPFAITVVSGPATGAAFTLSGGTPK